MSQKRRNELNSSCSEHSRHVLNQKRDRFLQPGFFWSYNGSEIRGFEEDLDKIA